MKCIIYKKTLRKRLTKILEVSKLKSLTFLSMFSILFIYPLFGKTIYVPQEYEKIQEALVAAENGDEIIISQGIYYEYKIDFLGKSVEVKSTDPNNYSVVTSTIINGMSQDRVFYFHSQEDSNSILLGVTISYGYDRGGISCVNSSPKITNCIIKQNSAWYNGGGIDCWNSSPIIINCIIEENEAWNYGGGIFLNQYSSPHIINCKIRGNNALTDEGGGVYSSFSSLLMINCEISANSAGFRGGGGIFCWESSMKLINCVISDNYAHTAGQEGGGGIHVYGNCKPYFQNCLITNNRSTQCGGGVYCHYDSASPIFMNCIIAENFSVYEGGGVYCNRSAYPNFINCVIAENSSNSSGGGIYCVTSSLPTLKNCILWNDVPEEISVELEEPIITFSNIKGGWSGKGNINIEPQFVNYKGYEYLLHPKSPCIDSGDPSIEDKLYDWHPKWPKWYKDGARSDMGAYGGPGNINWMW
jgi:predicted outer membrane repeat protein